MVPLLVIIASFKWYCRRTFDNGLRFDSNGLRSKESGEPTKSTKPNYDRIGVRFGHPALYKKLMVPLVAENASHLLKEIIHDQSDAVYHDANNYTDTFQMQRMSTRQSGQVDTTGNVAFETVNEDEMNFEHFRDREEFREFGGDGELYDNQADSSRSGSPASWQHTGSKLDVSQTNTGPAKELYYEGATYPTGYHSPSTFHPEPLARQLSEASTGPAPVTARQEDWLDVNLLGDVAPLGKAASHREARRD